MPLVTISRAKSWMKRTGSWASDVWNYLGNIQYLMQNQANVQTLLDSIAEAMLYKTTRIRFYHVRMVEKDHEYRLVLPEHTKSIEMQVTDGTAFRMSFDEGRVAEAKRPFWSVSTNTSWEKDKLDLHGTTVYFACSTANKMMELAIGT